MKSKELKEKLIRISELKHQIETDVKAIYEEHNNLTAECAEEIIKMKGGDTVGILKVSLPIKFKDGRKWVLRPNYMKGGHLNNVIWKPLGVHAFTIEEIHVTPKE